jgi:hypothetical protein
MASLAAIFFFASPVAAQEGASVVIMKFELLDVPGATTEAFEKTLTDGINAAPDMYVKTGGELNMNDLLLAVGCEEPNAECLGGLADFVEGDRIVFGTIQQSEDVTLFTVRMFDFAESRFIRETVDQTVQGDEAAVKAAIPAIVEGFVYGDTGVLTVNVAGADNAEIFFDGEKVGVAPMTLENLPLGEHAVAVKTRDGEEKTEKILLRNGQTETLDFSFGEGMADSGGGESSGGASTLPGWVAVGVGVLGAGLGVYGLLQESSVQSDLDAKCAAGNSGGNVCSGDSAALGSGAEAAEIQGLIDDGGTARTLQLAGFSVAAVGLAVGGFLLYTAYSSEPVETNTDAEGSASNDDGPVVTDITFGIAPTPDGVSAGLGFSF